MSHALVGDISYAVRIETPGSAALILNGFVVRDTRLEEAVDLRIRHETRESGEAAFRLQSLCGAHEAGPRRQRQRPADADPSHAESRDLLDIQADVPDHQQVER